MQIISQKLFVAAPGPPRICDYTGRGELRTWFHGRDPTVSLLRKGPECRPATMPCSPSGRRATIPGWPRCGSATARFKAAFGPRSPGSTRASTTAAPQDRRRLGRRIAALPGH
jgi:hypothetical protein